MAGAKGADAVLLGAVGGPKWSDPALRPEQAILGLRQALGLYANLRPSKLYFPASSPLRADIAAKGLDFVMVRELTGGIYFGERGKGEEGGEAFAFDTEKYTVPEIRRVGKVAFDIAMKRKKRLVSVDKENVLETSRLWRRVMAELSAEYPEVACENMLVDNAAMQLVANPSRFDVIVMSNLFGDILSDEAAAVSGSIGLAPSASLGAGSFGLYEPIHGSAPDIAGKGVANPLAAILSAALLLRHTFGLEEEAAAIERAVEAALKEGAATRDIARPGAPFLSTREMTEEVVKRI